MPRSVARLSTIHDEREDDPREDHQSLLFMPPTPLEGPSASSSVYWPSTSGSGSSSSSSSSDDNDLAPAENNEPQVQKRTHWTPIILIQLMIFLSAMGVVISFAPRTRLFEDIVCRKYYAIHNGTAETTTAALLSATTNLELLRQAPSESQCKIAPVQDALAELFGWQTFFDGIPGLLLAMYYGVLADKKGRSPVLFRSLLGQVLAAGWVLYVAWRCSSASALSSSGLSDGTEDGIIGGSWAHLLSLKATWLSSYFLIIGGGSTVTSAVGMMIVTDATTEENRSRVFFAALSTLITAELLGPAASTLMMRKWGLWVPLGVGFGCLVLSAVLTANMPETMHLKRASGSAVVADPEALMREEEEQYDVDAGASVVNGVNTNKGGDVHKSAIQVYRHAAHTLAYILHHPSILFVVLAFLVADYSRESLVILMQFVSTRYHIPIAQANLLNSFRAFTQLFVVTILLPGIDYLITHRLHVPALRKDLILSRISFSFVTACFGVLVWAPSLRYVFVSLTLYTLGSGFYPFARSLLASLVEPDMIGILFTTLAMMDTAGSLMAGPVVAWSFGWSLGLEGLWRGLPYMVSCVLCAVATVFLIFGVKAERPDSRDETTVGRKRPKGVARVAVRALRDVEEEDQDEGETRPLLAGR
ncbi:major facilitator superfamily domain-containing protein [Copromyces sp. CBS 386.78]|nr:major facilitator superfamily domain-containing protein [Copromyces sp. CBS 386.78]